MGSFLRALASSLEGNDCRLLVISTDSVEAHREFAGASLKELTIPLVEDKTGEISRAFGVFDPTTHSAVPTAFILDDEGELMASFTTSTQVGGSAEEVARVVAACRECDSSDAWSQMSKGTPASSRPGFSSDISQSKSKMSAKAEKTTVKKKEEEEVVNAMDEVQPIDSISNVSPN